MNNYWSPKVMMGAAVIGLVGAAGMFLYEQIYAEKRRVMLVNEVARLDKQVSTIRVELESLRELQKETQARRSKLRSRARREVTPAGDATDSEFTDCHSLAGTDVEFDSEEFYDVPSDEEDTLRETRNGRVPSLQNLAMDKESTDKQLTPRNDST